MAEPREKQEEVEATTLTMGKPEQKLFLAEAEPRKITLFCRAKIAILLDMHTGPFKTEQMLTSVQGTMVKLFIRV